MRTLHSVIAILLAAPFLHAADPVTFTETIAPILYDNCVTCHRPGEAAPFSLISYDDAKRRAGLMATVTASRYMPPWHAAHGYGEFAGERRLTDTQIATIAEWVKQGMPEGNRAKLPAVPRFTDGWQLGKPDMVIEMPTGFNVPASGPDVFRNFSIPLNLVEDKWLRAIEFRPSARKAAHHALFAAVPTGSTARYEGTDGQPGFGGMGTAGVSANQTTFGLGGWAVGTTPLFAPDGIAIPLPKGNDFLLQMHFHPTGKVEVEKSTIGLYFADKAPERKLVSIGLPAMFSVGQGINITPGDKNYMIRDSIVLPVDVKVYGSAAHAHYLGKEIEATATLPDGTKRPLIWIKDWDFNWQEVYNYKDPFVLPKGTRIEASLRYDNSVENPRNPSNPPRQVQFGEESFDEMGAVIFNVTALRAEDEAPLTAALIIKAQGEIRKGLADGTIRRFLDNQAKRGAPVPAVTGPRLQQIAIFDRQGKKVQNVGAPGLYGQILSMSPDGKRVAAIHTDQNTSQADVWVIEIATGKGTAITADADDNSVPVWSPDGNQVAYVTTIDKVSHIFRRAANGTGQAELLYKHSGPGLVAITDWSGDELVFWSGKVMYALAVAGDRKPIALSDGKFNVKEGRISPDGRFIAYNSDQGGRSQVYVSKRGSTVGVPLVDETAIGGIFWPSGGKELYYLTTQGQQVLHTVDLRVEGDTVTAGASRELFRLPSPLLPVAQMSSFATPDGQRFVFLVPADTP